MLQKHKLLRYLSFLLIISCNIGCDQISKSAVREHVEYEDMIQVIGNHVILTKVENSGAFLSVGDELPVWAKNLLLNILPAISLLFLVVWIFSRKLGSMMTIGLCSVAGGGIGNIFDRVMYGSVTDFLYVRVGIFQTGIFNFADVSITAGVLLMIWFQITQYKKT